MKKLNSCPPQSMIMVPTQCADTLEGCMILYKSRDSGIPMMISAGNRDMMFENDVKGIPATFNFMDYEVDWVVLPVEYIRSIVIQEE